MAHSVLIIEDDKDIVSLLEIHLKDLNCQVSSVLTGDEGFALCSTQVFDLIILDLMLPGLDGLEVCRRIRSQDNYTPILMLTAKSEDIDKIIGLETGADDYMTKPFNVREFISRVKAIFRRVKMLKEDDSGSNGIIHFRDLQVEMDKRKVIINNESVSLTPKEYDLLVEMATHAGKSYSREELLNKVWGYEFLGYEHTVNSHINRLRTKIEKDIGNPEFILTTWGVGYRFNDEE